MYGEQASARFLQEAMSTIVMLVEGCDAIFSIWDKVALCSIQAVGDVPNNMDLIADQYTCIQIIVFH